MISIEMTDSLLCVAIVSSAITRLYMGITSSFRGENKTEKPLGVMVTGTKLLPLWPLEN